MTSSGGQTRSYDANLVDSNTRQMKQLELLKKRKQSEARALTIIQKLIYNPVHEDFLIDSIRFINQEHYQDVIVERAISSLCGYPLCLKQLGEIPKQKFHISLRRTKVFDITERKNFCSNLCYKASKYLENQLLTSPVWLREEEKVLQIHLLPVEVKVGSVGEEVDLGLGDTRITKGLVSSLETSNHFEKTEKKQELSDMTVVNTHLREVVDAASTASVTQSLSNDSVQNADEFDSLSEKLSQILVNESAAVDVDVLLNSIKDNAIKPALELGNAGEQNKFDCFVARETSGSSISAASTGTQVILKTDNLVTCSAPRSSYESTSSQMTENVYVATPSVTNMESNQLCKESEGSNGQLYTSKKKLDDREKMNSRRPKGKSKVNTLDGARVVVAVVEHTFNSWLTLASFKVLIGDEKVKELMTQNRSADGLLVESRSVNNTDLPCCLKSDSDKSNDECDTISSSINTSSRQVPSSNEISENLTKVEALYSREVGQRQNLDEVKNCKNFSIPHTSLSNPHAPQVQRRKIVLEKLSRVFSELLPSLGLSKPELTTALHLLVSTFRLEANNIMFKPPEWTLIAIYLLYMLATREEHILNGLKKNSRLLTIILQGYDMTVNQLELRVKAVMDIYSLMRFQSNTGEGVT